MKSLLALTVTAILISGGCARRGDETATDTSTSASQPDPALPMIGFVDIPQRDEVTIKANTEQSIGGWVLWGKQSSEVRILVDGQLAATAPVNIFRPDVARIHATYNTPNSGWGTPIPNNVLTVGKHIITVQVVSRSGESKDLKTIRLNVM